MRARNLGLVLLFCFCAGALVACGGGDAGTNDDAGAADAGLDAQMPIDSGLDAGRDAGTPCTTGCAWVEVALLFESSCARRENGEVKCWGRAQDGEIGDGRMRHSPGCPVEGAADDDCSSRPQIVALAQPATAISARGGFSACALVAGGDVWCWGREGYDVAMSASVRYAPERLTDVSSIAAVSESHHTVCFLESDGTPLCAGENGVGQTGGGDLGSVFVPRQVVVANPADPTAPTPLEGVIELDTGTFFATFGCARTADTVYCWGSNESGQLGTGDTVYPTCGSSLTSPRCSPVAVPIASADLDATQVAELALGSGHVCARMLDGTVRCWGENRAGQLGVGDAMQRNVPTAVPGVTEVAQIVAGGSFTCARRTDGTVSCWGLNNQGQVGDGSTVHGNCTIGTEVLDCAVSPVQVMGIDDATFIAAGRNHACAIRAGGAEIWCWGQDESLQLGDGPNSRPLPADRTPRFAPVMVEGL